MKFGRREQAPQVEEKVIEIAAQMQGSLVFSEPVNLRINGHFQGSLEARGSLTVGSSADVTADLKGDSIVIAGKVRGNISARKLLVLMPTAVVTGDLSCPKLNVVEGAVFDGACRMHEEPLSVEEVAHYLELEPATIAQLATEGKIPATREGEAWRFERSKIDQWATGGKMA